MWIYGMKSKIKVRNQGYQIKIQVDNTSGKIKVCFGNGKKVQAEA